MYLRPTDKYWAIDIEADSLTPTKVWCLTAVNIFSQEEFASNDSTEIAAWLTAKKAEGAKFIGHNIVSYDAPSLNRLLGTRLTINDLIDTMIMSMVYSPSLAGGHSLSSWGERLYFPKGDFHDFSHYSPKMLSYCLNDSKLCRLIYMDLVRRMTKAKFTDFGLDIEHRSWQLIDKQSRDGFAFDIQGAHVLYAQLRHLEQELQEKIYAIWPPELQCVRTFKNPFKKDGSPSTNYLRHCDEYETVVLSGDRDEYQCFAFVPFNIGSPLQRVEKLLALGWEPHASERTPTGLPKPTDKGRLVPSLVEFVESSGLEGPGLIAKWIEINSRANMINTWMEAYNETTHCIHGNLWLANTLRYRHSNPNTANIPAVRTNKADEPLMGLDGVFTYEARNLWRTRSPVDRLLVGVDAKGIQLRVLANYLNNPAFTKEVIDGDPHSYNQEIGGFRTRPMAKTFIYAFLLGAGDEKVGQIIGGSTKDGKATKRRFVNNFPGLGDLLDRLEGEVRSTGRIILCDGTPLIVSAPHTRLGYLLQGDESRIMKLASIFSAREIKKRVLDVIKVGDIHDEWQNDTLRRHVAELIEEVYPLAFRTSGEAFKYRVPIECSSKVGETWAETH